MEVRGVTLYVKRRRVGLIWRTMEKISCHAAPSWYQRTYGEPLVNLLTSQEYNRNPHLDGYGDANITLNVKRTRKRKMKGAKRNRVRLRSCKPCFSSRASDKREGKQTILDTAFKQYEWTTQLTWLFFFFFERCCSSC